MKHSTLIDYNDTKLMQLYSDMVKTPMATNSMRGVNHGQMTVISLTGDRRDTALEQFRGDKINQVQKYENKIAAPAMVEQKMTTNQQI